MSGRPDTITDVPGVEVGHAEVEGGRSGCTVLLGGMRVRADLRGLATGTRELATLRDGHVTSRVDALLLTGGSAFGLAAADGVMRWLEDHGRGHSTSIGPVPIVPAAVLFDLAPDRPRPGPEQGWVACQKASSDPVPEGRVGAGAGATVGKLEGVERASAGGVGSASVRWTQWTLGALVVTNALGNVVDSRGRVVGRDGSEEDATRALLESTAPGNRDRTGFQTGENTTLGVVLTDAPVDAEGLVRIARLATTAVARRISPSHTPFDGDVVFAGSTAEDTAPQSTRDTLALGVAAREALETAILRSVRPRPE